MPRQKHNVVCKQTVALWIHFESATACPHHMCMHALTIVARISMTVIVVLKMNAKLKAMAASHR